MTFEGGWCARCAVDLEKPPFFTGFEVFPEPAKSAALSVDKIMVNGPIRDSEFAFPAKETLSERMTVRDCSEEGLLETLGAMGIAARAEYVRLAAHNPEIREALKFSGLVGIDWKEIEKNDLKYAPLLREALSRRQARAGSPERIR